MADLGFIGLGIMGKPMAGHLVNAGHTVHVFSRSPGPVKELEAAGAVACKSSKEVSEKSEITFIIVPNTPDVNVVLFGFNGVAEGAKKGSVVVDMSSISPIATREFAEKL
jgi:2-hydroxy-3-oxopropionate reductase